MNRLILTSPQFRNQSCDLPDGTWCVGRNHSCDILIRDESISGCHCALLVYGTEVIVRESGSLNGTFVDGMRVKAQSGVRHRQRIRFGSVEGQIEIEPPTGDTPTPITALDSLRKYLRQTSEQANGPKGFPVIFSPSPLRAFTPLSANSC